jgi:agmatine deiminase
METMSTPAALGYRMPAEWEPHAATWLSWPNKDGISFPDAYHSVMPVLARLRAGTHQCTE